MKVNHAIQTLFASNQQSQNTNEVGFSDLLNANRGYDIEELKDGFEVWKGDYITSGISLDVLHDVQNLSEDFIAIMEKSINEGGYDDPLGFVKSLSKEELHVLQKMNVLADPIDTNQLSEEGALNLILPRNMKADLNDDGFTMTGIAVGWSFPPVNAPDNVKQAWDKATEDMTSGEKMVAMGSFLPFVMEENYVYDDNENLMGVRSVGSENHINPYAEDGFSYVDMLRDRLDALEYFKASTDPQQYERQKEFFTKLLNAMQEFGVA